MANEVRVSFKTTSEKKFNEIKKKKCTAFIEKKHMTMVEAGSLKTIPYKCRRLKIFDVPTRNVT